MSKDSLAKYYRDNKKRLQKKTRERYQSLSEEENEKYGLERYKYLSEDEKQNLVEQSKSIAN